MKVKRFILTVAATIFVSGAALASSYEDAIDAALNNRPDDLAPLLKQGFDPNTATPGGNADPLLSSAIRNKSYNVIDLLLNQKNIDLNKPNVLYETPLMLAIFYKEMVSQRNYWLRELPLITRVTGLPCTTQLPQATTKLFHCF